MNQRTIQHPRHDLHVAVRMGLEPRSGRDRVVVVDDEQAMVRISTQWVDSGIERMPSVQPPDPGLAAVRVAAKAHARVQERSRTHANLTEALLDGALLDYSSYIMERNHRRVKIGTAGTASSVTSQLCRVIRDLPQGLDRSSDHRVAFT